MLLPRMTTRRWMVLVLAIALSIEFGRWGWSRSKVYALKASQHADRERKARLGMMQFTPLSRARTQRLVSGRVATTLASRPRSKDLLAVWDGPPIEELSPTALQVARREAAEWNQLVIYHSWLRRKYEWATWFPWLPVWGDPTEPE